MQLFSSLSLFEVFAVVVQLLSHVRLCDHMNYSTPGFPVLYYLPDFARTHVHWFSEVMPCNPGMAFILYHPLHLLPSIFPSIRVFSNESALRIRWPKYQSFSFSISPSNELILIRIDWFDLLVVQGTLKSLLQHHSLKASILWHSAFFMVQLLHLYMATRRKNIIVLPVRKKKKSSLNC